MHTFSGISNITLFDIAEHALKIILSRYIYTIHIRASFLKMFSPTFILSM